MEEITVTFLHTDIEESNLLVVGGIDPLTADMMWEILDNREPKVYLGYEPRQANAYPQYYKPCWSRHQLIRMIYDMGYCGERITDPNRLVPILLSLLTMKEYRENHHYSKKLIKNEE